ncbi:hypothetical protein BC937DRAFT_94811, partial [Endogone sp. FLAS-F59071]
TLVSCKKKRKASKKKNPKTFACHISPPKPFLAPLHKQYSYTQPLRNSPPLHSSPHSLGAPHMPSTTNMLKQEPYQQAQQAALAQQQSLLQQLSGHSSHGSSLLGDSSSASSSSPLSTPSSSTPGTPAPTTAELIKRDLINQKVRAENRERKKRWREQNEDRNKDNDLRCRVNKRANKLFGKGDSDHKHRWIEEEFGKRQMKRKEKERRKQAVNGAIGANPALTNLATSGIITAQQQAQISAQLSAAAANGIVGVPHPNGGFYPMSTNGMAPLSPTTTAKLLGGNLSAAMKKNHQFLNGLIGSDAAHLPQFPASDPTSPTAASAHIHHHHHHHLHIQDLATGKLPTPPGEGSDFSGLDHAASPINGQGLQAMASGLSSSPASDSESEEAASPQIPHHQSQQGAQGQQGQQGQGGNGQGGDYPMDAVLTLMQLNAGWRQ